MHIKDAMLVWNNNNGKSDIADKSLPLSYRLAEYKKDLPCSAGACYADFQSMGTQDQMIDMLLAALFFVMEEQIDAEEAFNSMMKIDEIKHFFENKRTF